MRKIISFVIFVGLFLNSYSQAFSVFLKDYQIFSDKYLIESVFLHTDKNEYSAKEDIMFKVYVWDAKHKKPSKINQIVFVELISSDFKIIDRKNIFVQNGVGNSFFELADTLTEANYQLRAYTNSMTNFSSKYFFVKDIYLNTNYEYCSSTYFKNAKKLLRKNKKLYFNYNTLNDGLLKHVENNIQFIIQDNQGKFVNTNVFITNKKDSVFCDLKNVNIGFMSFMSKFDEAVYIKVESDLYKDVKIKLKEYSFVNQPIIYFDSTSFSLSFSQKIKKSDSIANTYLLIVERDGTVFYQNYMNNYSDTINILKNELPSGMLNFIFINKSGDAEFVFQINNKLKQQQGCEISINNDNSELTLIPFEEDTVYASISISCNNNSNIVHYLELQSFFENNLFFPVDFSFDFSPYSTNFSKYDFTKLKDLSKVQEVNKPINEISVSGYVSNILDNVPAKFAHLKLFVLNSYNDVFFTRADEKGYFNFNLPKYSDTIEYLIEATTSNGKKHVVINVNSYDTNQIYFFPFRNLDLHSIKNYRIIQKKKSSYKSDDGALYRYPDQIIYSDEIQNSGQNSVLNVLQGRVPGFTRNGNSAILRGYSSINQSNEPLYLLDNIPVNVGTIEALNIRDIDRIEIVKNAGQTAMYGSRGSNGIISVYTKKGHNIDWGKTSGLILGIATEKKFINNNGQNIETVYWNPNIVISKKTEFIFPQIDSANCLSIVIQGFTSKGRLVNYTKQLTY